MTALVEMTGTDFLEDRKRRVALLDKNPKKIKAIKDELRKHDFVEKSELAERLVFNQLCAQNSERDKDKALQEGIEVELDRTNGMRHVKDKRHIIVANLQTACNKTGDVKE